MVFNRLQMTMTMTLVAAYDFSKQNAFSFTREVAVNLLL